MLNIYLNKENNMRESKNLQTLYLLTLQSFQRR